MAKNKSLKDKTRKITKKKKKFSVGDYMALGVFTLILLAALSATGYFYGIYRPQTNEIVAQRAEEFGELSFTIDHEDFSFQPLYVYLSPAHVRAYRNYEQRFQQEYSAKQYTRVVHEIETKVIQSGWDKAKVQVDILVEENSILMEESNKEWITMQYEFEKFNGDWIIAKFTQDETND